MRIKSTNDGEEPRPGPKLRRSGVARGVGHLARRVGAAVLLFTVVLAGPVGCGDETLQRAWSNLTASSFARDAHGDGPAGEPQRSVERVTARHGERTRGSSTAPSASSPRETRAVRAPQPVVTEARASALRVRVGESVEIKLRVENQGGSARRGTLSVTLVEHPPMRLGFQSDLVTRFVDSDQAGQEYGTRSREAPRAEIRAESQNWGAGESHTLRLQFIPAEPGTIRLYYRLQFEGADGVVATYPMDRGHGPASSDGRGVAIHVTRTLQGDRR